MEKQIGKDLGFSNPRKTGEEDGNRFAKDATKIGAKHVNEQTMEITDLQGSPRKKSQAEGVKKTETDLQRMLQRSEPNMCRDGRDR
jgi:hypothetical protein